MNVTELHTYLEQYLALRHALGFELRPQTHLLHEFVNWLEEQNFNGAISAQQAIDWACRKPHCDHQGASARRLSGIRGFLGYLHASEPDTKIPEQGLLDSPRRPQPHIYPEAEIKALIKAAQGLRPRNGLRPHTYTTLIGLLLSCGLRIGEAIKLRLADIDLVAEPPRLHIEQTKFGKSRIVPMHPSTAVALHAYAKNRARLGYDGFCTQFFVSEKRAPLNLTTVEKTFLSLARQAELRGPAGESSPKLGDLRHTFMVERLRQWYQDGIDVRSRLPELSVYVGHTRLEHTYWYLSSTPELLGIAAERFAVYANTGGAS
jgi:integrase/recombinase XerD